MALIFTYSCGPLAVAQVSKGPRVQGAGLMPNALNRFVQSNTHEVLFVT